MANITKTFAFASTADGWTLTAGTWDSVAFTSGDGNPAGSIAFNDTGRNDTASTSITWTGTFEDLGVPSGFTVTGYSAAAFDHRCAVWNVVDSASLGDFSINDGTARTLVTAQSYTGTTTWATKSASPGITGLSLPSTTSVTLSVAAAGDNGNNNAAQVELRLDNVSLTIEYQAGSQSLTATRYDNAQTFYSPTVAAGAAQLTPALFTNSNTFYAATISQVGPAQSLTPALYSNAQTFYAPTVTSSYALTASPVENTSVFYGLTITQSGGVDIQVSWVVFDTQGGNLVNLLPGLLTNANTFYAHAVSPGPVTLTATRYDNASTFYAPTVNRGTVTLQPGLYSNANTFYPATVTAGGVTLTPARYDNTSTLYAPTVAASNTLQPGRYDNTNAFYAATVTTATTLTAALFENTNTFYQAVVSSGGKILLVPLLENVNAFYGPTVTASGVTLLPGLYENQNTFFVPTVTSDSVPVFERGDGVGPWRKKRDERIAQERREREQLRELIAQAIDPIEEGEVKVVASEDAVAIVPKTTRAVAIPTFPTIDVAEVRRAVNAALEAAGIAAKQARDAQAKAKAQAAMRRMAEDNIRKRLKRRREEEFLLLM